MNSRESDFFRGCSFLIGMIIYYLAPIYFLIQATLSSFWGSLQLAQQEAEHAQFLLSYSRCKKLF